MRDRADIGLAQDKTVMEIHPEAELKKHSEMSSVNSALTEFGVQAPDTESVSQAG